MATVQAAVDAAKLHLASTTSALAAARDQHVAADKAATSAAAGLAASLADVPEDLRDAAAVTLRVHAAIEHRDQSNDAHQLAVENERRASEKAAAGGRVGTEWAKIAAFLEARFACGQVV
jgi:ABC-type transporter Mla subunit MlaD